MLSYDRLGQFSKVKNDLHKMCGKSDEPYYEVLARYGVKKSSELLESTCGPVLADLKDLLYELQEREAIREFGGG